MTGVSPRVYGFRPMSAADLSMVGRWLNAPHVAAWWHEPDQQSALVRSDLDDPAMNQFIVTTGNRPFAYLQCYDPATWPDNGLGAHPDGTRGIDQFIGEPNMIGCGHGSGFIRQFTDHLLTSRLPRVVTDPDPDNGRAVRAYAKAGFQSDRLVDTPDGPALLMVRDP
jgi:aminoglycoside 6'-N-acetyltransferase